MDSGVTAPAEVVIFDGDPIVGRALGLLLQCDGCNVRFLEVGSLERPEVLEGVRVLLLGPRWSAEGRRAVLAMSESEQANAEREGRFRILEVGAPPEGVPAEPERHIPWPCGITNLSRRVKALLAGEPKPGDGA